MSYLQQHHFDKTLKVLKLQVFIIKFLFINSLIKLLYFFTVYILTIFQHVLSLSILENHSGTIEILKLFQIIR